jgi:nucleotide-binding universal stress UspA family protein
MGFKKILVATDFSPCSARALEVAGRLATTLGARVVLCHALEAPDENTLLGGSLKPLVDFPVEQRKAETALRAEAKRAGLDRHLDEVVVRLHQAGNEVPAAAEEHGCDLIVIGTHGRTGFRHLVIGSVAEKVVRTAKVPVLTVPGGP